MRRLTSDEKQLELEQIVQENIWQSKEPNQERFMHEAL